MWKAPFQNPGRLFLFFSILAGLIICFLVPPFGGGNEMYNFQRLAAIAYGHPLVEKAEVPGGILELIKAGGGFFHEGMQPPFSYTMQQQDRLLAIRLDVGSPATLIPNAITVHHPFCYLPQVMAFRLGAAFGLRPLYLFYLARLSGLFASVALIFFALRIAPSHRYMLCALALLPPITFSRSCIDADPVTTGLAFLFTACMLREITREGPLQVKDIVILSVLAFIMAPCKNIYLGLPLLAFAIPKARFAQFRSRIATLCVIIAPALLMSMTWLLLLKGNPYVTGAYHTWGGEVNPQKQIAFIEQHPLTYLGVICRTIFMTPFLPQALQGVIGVFGPPVSLPPFTFVVIIALFFTAIVSDTTSKNVTYSLRTKLLALAIFAIFLIISLTALYVDWTGVGLPVIEGFQGRYFYPLLPLLAVFAKPLDKPLSLPPQFVVITLACTGIFSVIATIIEVYYG